jgi:16S rRNA (uracil1498-N3)-methyltransferase
VTAALFLVEPEVTAAAEVGGFVRLEGPEGRHAVTVTRIGAGERIDLGDGAGIVLHTLVESVQGRDALVARVLDRVVEPPPQPRVVVVQALAKGDRGETAVEMMAEVGVDVIVPWQAERSIARWTADRAERGRARWAATVRAAGKQSRRARFPEIADVAGTPQLVELVRTASLAIVLHEEAAAPLAALTIPPTGDVVLVVGPEGGVSPAELEVLVAAGARPARLGPSVLRTSTAGTVAAGIVLARSSRWD